MTAALITGASRNIGRAIALALAHDGFDVALLARSDRAVVDGADPLIGAGARDLGVVDAPGTMPTWKSDGRTDEPMWSTHSSCWPANPRPH